jgi:hypothetical protein
MSDLWIEDWYKFKDARAMLEVATSEALKAGMTQQEIWDTITSQFPDAPTLSTLSWYGRSNNPCVEIESDTPCPYVTSGTGKKTPLNCVLSKGHEGDHIYG